MPRKPKDDESRDEYVPFCVSWMIDNGEYPNNEEGRKQAVAHCHSIYDEHGTGKSKDKYQCECLECGKVIESDKHCDDIKCPYCNGKMRRVDRPGIGRKSLKVPMNIKGNLNVINKSIGKPHIIAGYASVIEIDTENQYIPKQALEKGITSLLGDECFANLNLRHSNIQIGKILKEYGKLKTHVDEIGLFIVAEVRQDLEVANQVWKSILDGELRAFSIAGEIVETHNECDDTKCYEVIDELNIFEITVCQKPVNSNSGFTIISKNVCKECEKIDDTMTKKEIKDTKKESEDCEDCDVEEKEDSEDKFSEFERRIKAIEETINQIANSDEDVTEEKSEDEVTLEDISKQLSEIIKLNEETETDEKSEEEESESFEYPYPEKLSDEEDWHKAIANAIDDLYTKIASLEKQEEEDDEEEPPTDEDEEVPDEDEDMNPEEEEDEEEDEEMKSEDTESKSEEDVTEEKSDESTEEKSEEDTSEKSDDIETDEKIEKSDDESMDMSDEKEIKYAIKSRDEAIQGYEQKIEELNTRIKELENAEQKPRTKVEKSDDDDSYDYNGIIKKGGTIYRE